LSTRFWSEPHRPQGRLCDVGNLGAGDRLAAARVAVGSPIALQRVRGARWRGFVLIAQLLLSQVPKFIFPTFGPAGFFPKLVRSRVDLLFARFWHYISPSWSTAPPSGGLGHIGGTVPDQLGDTGHPIQVHMKPLVPRRDFPQGGCCRQDEGQAGITTHGLSRTVPLLARIRNKKWPQREVLRRGQLKHPHFKLPHGVVGTHLAYRYKREKAATSVQ
jgi:hypothetical protein